MRCGALKMPLVTHVNEERISFLALDPEVVATGTRASTAVPSQRTQTRRSGFHAVRTAKLAQRLFCCAFLAKYGVVFAVDSFFTFARFGASLDGLNIFDN
jgi:hypothetical protein